LIFWQAPFFLKRVKEAGRLSRMASKEITDEGVPVLQQKFQVG
jgi:hypothetical protein